jgi:hypothetical protein
MAQRRGSARRRFWIACLLLALSSGLPGGAEREVSVRGAVTDETGEPVPGHTVRLLKSRSVVHLGTFSSRDQNVEEVRAVTDGHGFFEFTFPADSQFPYYYLRFYDPKAFDVVKYRLPEDKEISRRVRQGRPVQVSVVLRYQEDWSKVKALIDEYGPASHCGQILRSLGLPSSRIPLENDREVWRFDRAGVSYVIQGSKVLETHTIPKTSPRRRPLGDAEEEQPVPAERVEDR